VRKRRLYLLDTNTVTYVVIGKSEAARARYLERERDARIAVSVVTEGEIRYGIARNPDAIRRNSLMLDFLNRVECFPWDASVAGPYGTLRAALEAKGALTGPLDLMIAAHALSLDATLVTHDRALKRLTNFITVEDWATDLP